MSGRSQTGHNQMLRRRRMKKFGKKQLRKNAKRLKKMMNKQK